MVVVDDALCVFSQKGLDCIKRSFNDLCYATDYKETNAREAGLDYCRRRVDTRALRVPTAPPMQIGLIHHSNVSDWFETNDQPHLGYVPLSA